MRLYFLQDASVRPLSSLGVRWPMAIGHIGCNLYPFLFKSPVSLCRDYYKYPHLRYLQALTLCRRSHSMTPRRSKASKNGKPSSAPTTCYPSRKTGSQFHSLNLFPIAQKWFTVSQFELVTHRAKFQAILFHSFNFRVLSGKFSQMFWAFPSSIGYSLNAHFEEKRSGDDVTFCKT